MAGKRKRPKGQLIIMPKDNTRRPPTDGDVEASRLIAREAEDKERAPRRLIMTIMKGEQRSRKKLTENDKNDLTCFLNDAMQKRNLCGSNERPITDIEFIFVSFINPEMASRALKLDRIVYHDGSVLSFRRPEEYKAPPPADDNGQLIIMPKDNTRPVADGDVEASRLIARKAENEEKAPRRLIMKGAQMPRKNMTENDKAEFICFLNDAMQKRNLCGSNERPITDIDSIFVSFINPEMASRALKLGRIIYHGFVLSFRRPEEYKAPLPADDNVVDQDKIARQLVVMSGIQILRLDRLDLWPFLDFLNYEMRKRKLCGPENRVIVGTEDSVFLVAANPEMATRVLTVIDIHYRGSNLFFRRPKQYAAAASKPKTTGPPDVVAVKNEPLGATVPTMKKVTEKTSPKAVGGDETANADPPLSTQRLLDDMTLELAKAKKDANVMTHKLESTQEVLKEAQDAKKAADFKQEFLENLIQKWESDMHEAKTQLDTQGQNLADTRVLLKEAQDAKEQADSNQELLRGAIQTLESDLQRLSKDCHSQQQELVRLRQEQLLKDGKAQAATTLLEIDKCSLEKITNKLGLQLEAVGKDRDSKETKLADSQRLLEQAKGVADSNLASMCTAHKKLCEIGDQLKTKDDMLEVANEELSRLRTKLEESTKVDVKVNSTEFEELQKKYDDSEQRSHRMTDLLSNTMDELIAERRSRRVLDTRIEDLEADCASEKALRKRAESQVESASISAVNIGKKAVKDEWDL
jgi:hypothetical protein